MSVKIDLHVHSSYSDGTLSPVELAALAVEKGLSVMAICDHDSTEALGEAAAACRLRGIGFLGAVEISTLYDGGLCHLLGYGIDPEHSGLQAALKTCRQARLVRNEVILDKLNRLGLRLDLDQLLIKGRNLDTLGRPRIAKLMLEQGLVRDIKDAFTRYLGKQGAAYVEKQNMSPIEVIELIDQAGGITVLAHPVSLNLEYKALARLVQTLKKAGLGGLEVHNSLHHLHQAHALARLCDETGLWQTAGSDFHGTNKSNAFLGLGSDQIELVSNMVSPDFWRFVGLKTLCQPG